MGITATYARPAKTHPTGKNRVWENFSLPNRTRPENRRNPQQPLRKNRPTPTKTASGVEYYGYRYYDPKTGRWPSRDPMGELGGMNLYGFVRNDGVGRIDVLGNAAWGWVVEALGADIIDAIGLPDWLIEIEIDLFGGPEKYMDATEGQLQKRGQLSVDMFRKARNKDGSMVDEDTDLGKKIQTKAINGSIYSEKRDHIIRRLQEGTLHKGFLNIDFQNAGEEPLATSIGGGQLHYEYFADTKEVEFILKDTYDFANKGHTWDWLERNGYLGTYPVDVWLETKCIDGVQ